MRLRWLTIVLVGVGVLSACAQPEPTATPTPTPTPTPSATATPTPTASPALPPPVSTTVTLAPSQDTTLFETSTGNLSSGSGGHLFAGKTGQDLRRRALVQFDVAGAVPAGATITRVTLTLNMTRTVARATDVSLHRVDASWGEGGSPAGPRGGGEGAASQSGDATWVHRSFDAVQWATPGGDFDAAASATSPVDANGVYSWESDGMGADVQGWLNDPATNNGWLLMGDESRSRTAKRFTSREGLAAARPTLTVIYTTPG